MHTPAVTDFCPLILTVMSPPYPDVINIQHGKSNGTQDESKMLTGAPEIPPVIVTLLGNEPIIFVLTFPPFIFSTFALTIKTDPESL